jgi:hypothetical protein
MDYKSILIFLHIGYIGASDLVPEVNKHESILIKTQHFSAFAGGAGLMFIFKILID